MDDNTILILYSVKFGVLVTFSIAAFYRAWTNHLHHHHLRWALVWLGCFMASLAGTLGYRMVAASNPPEVSRIILRTWHFGVVELSATVFAVVLFFVLQKPIEGGGR